MSENYVWKVERIDDLHESKFRQFVLDEEQFDKMGESLTSTVRNIRNYSFAGGWGFFTILLGLFSLGLITSKNFYFVTIPIVIAFLAVIVLCTILLRNCTEIFRNITKTVLDGQEKISESKSYFVAKSINLENLNDAQLGTYAAFVNVLSYASKVDILMALNEGMKSKSFTPSTRGIFDTLIQKIIQEIKMGRPLPDSPNNDFLPSVLLEYTINQYAKFDNLQIKILEKN